MPAFLNCLKRRFPLLFRSTPLQSTRLFRSAAGDRVIRRGFVGRQILLSRELIHYEHLDFRESLSHARRAKALALRVQMGSPYAHTGHTAIWRGGSAQVWFWDATRAEKGPRGHHLPEPLFHPPLSTGARLWQLDQGYEAQVWRAGELWASQYWAQAPSADAWRHFARQAGAAEAMPAAEPAPWLDKPFANVAGGQRGKLQEQGPRLWLALFLVLGFLGLWQGEQYLKYQQYQQTLQQSLRRLRTRGQVLLDARKSAESQLAEARAIQRHMSRPSPLVIMNALLRVMPTGVTIQSYRQRSSSIVVKFSKQPLLNVAKIIAKIQNMPFIAAVNPANARRGQLELHIQLQ